MSAMTCKISAMTCKRPDVQGVRSDVKGVGDNVKGVDARVQGISNDVKRHFQRRPRRRSQIRPGQPFVISLTPVHCSEDSDNSTGNQLRDSLLRWLSPPDPSFDHHIACKARHDGTAQWFLQGSIFNQWKSTDRFSWFSPFDDPHLLFL